LAQTKEERKRSETEGRERDSRVREKLVEDTWKDGGESTRTDVQSCISCDNPSEERKEICCFGLFKDQKSRWRCTPYASKDNYFKSNRGRFTEIPDSHGNYTINKSNNSNEQICQWLGNNISNKTKKEKGNIESWKGDVIKVPERGKTRIAANPENVFSFGYGGVTCNKGGLAQTLSKICKE